MSKKDFIALADMIRAHNRNCSLDEMFTELQIAALAEFCREQNSDFKRDRWLQYIDGKCGQNGGSIPPRRRRRTQVHRDLQALTEGRA